MDRIAFLIETHNSTPIVVKEIREIPASKVGKAVVDGKVILFEKK